MSAAAKFRKAVGMDAHDPARVAQLGHHIWRVIESTERELGRLLVTPATLAQVLGCEPIPVGFDLGTMERLLAEADGLADEPGASFTASGAQHSLADWADQLRGILHRARPYCEARRAREREAAVSQ